MLINVYILLYEYVIPLSSNWPHQNSDVGPEEGEY